MTDDTTYPYAQHAQASLGRLGRSADAPGLATDHGWTLGSDRPMRFGTHRMSPRFRRDHEPQSDRQRIYRRLDTTVQRLPYTRPHAPRRNALLVLVYTLCLLLFAGITRDLLAAVMVV